MISSRDMEQWCVGPDQGGGGGTVQVQGDPRLGTYTDNSIEGGNCEEVHGHCVVSASTHITHTTDKTEYANPKTTTTTNTSVQLSLTTSIIHTSNTGQAQQHQAQDGECEDGDDSPSP